MIKSVIDCAVKVAVIAGIAVGSYWAVNNVKDEKFIKQELSAQKALDNQTKTIRNTFEKLKNLNNKEVDKIVGINR